MGPNLAEASNHKAYGVMKLRSLRAAMEVSFLSLWERVGER
jgi:hypothetical protein